MVCYSPESIDIYIAGQSLSSATKPTGVPIRGRQRLMTSLHQTHFGTNQETAVIDDITAPNKMWHQSRDGREWWRHITKQTTPYKLLHQSGGYWWRHRTKQIGTPINKRQKLMTPQHGSELLSIYRGYIWYDDAHSTAITVIKLRSHMHSRTTLHSELWGVFHELYDENDRDISRVH